MTPEPHVLLTPLITGIIVTCLFPHSNSFGARAGAPHSGLQPKHLTTEIPLSRMCHLKISPAFICVLSEENTGLGTCPAHLSLHLDICFQDTLASCLFPWRRWEAMSLGKAGLGWRGEGRGAEADKQAWVRRTG